MPWWQLDAKKTELEVLRASLVDVGDDAPIIESKFWPATAQ